MHHKSGSPHREQQGYLPPGSVVACRYALCKVRCRYVVPFFVCRVPEQPSRFCELTKLFGFFGQQTKGSEQKQASHPLHRTHILARCSQAIGIVLVERRCHISRQVSGNLGGGPGGGAGVTLDGVEGADFAFFGFVWFGICRRRHSNLVWFRAGLADTPTQRRSALCTQWCPSILIFESGFSFPSRLGPRSLRCSRSPTPSISNVPVLDAPGMTAYILQ